MPYPYSMPHMMQPQTMGMNSGRGGRGRGGRGQVKSDWLAFSWGCMSIPLFRLGKWDLVVRAGDGSGGHKNGMNRKGAGAMVDETKVFRGNSKGRLYIFLSGRAGGISQALDEGRLECVGL